MSASGGTKAILAALVANAGIAVAKFVGFLVTGSSSMLAESVHSVADTSNQGLLLLGQKRAKKAATQLHPFGFGRNRYFYSFVVALVLFTLGSMFALYEGIHKISHPEELTSPGVAIGVLLVAVGLETYSFRTAVHESRPLKGRASWWQFIRTSRSPELPVVLLEDAGALVGLLLALVGVGMSVLTGDPVWDGIGTVSIGLLLGVIAVILIIEMQSLLIGEGATPGEEQAIQAALVGGAIDRVVHLKTQYLGPEELLVAAKVAVGGDETSAGIAAAIDAAEERVRAAVPAARVIYLEPDLYRAPAAGALRHGAEQDQG
ncbi:cation diffusion facilitator family transporter [Rhodococcus sp. X156]|uniref:cation diffusion facilitator family transporter n=1 Tax=Rhodococcus sp. X156 TaxID=2499145 RepID=UPI000FD909FB|nr:cation diffusion facilitator family transporter [Rhodococcus sp. X156]